MNRNSNIQHLLDRAMIVGVLTRLLFITFALLNAAAAFAQGGPPMVTDDPGTPGDGRWEINLLSLLSSDPNEELIQFPYFDINYGLGDRVQLKLETGWVISKDNAPRERTGAGTVLIGVKYRFLDEEKYGISVSTYPQFQFHHFFSSHDPELTAPGNQILLPIEASKTFGNWEINPEMGYLYGTVVANELFYGIIFAYEGLKPFEPLAEVHVNTRLDGEGNIILLNFGVRYTLNPHVILIGAIGHTITHLPGDSTEFDTNAGLQLEL